MTAIVQELDGYRTSAGSVRQAIDEHVTRLGTKIAGLYRARESYVDGRVTANAYTERLMADVPRLIGTETAACTN